MYKRQSQDTRDEELAARTHTSDLHGNDYLTVYFARLKRRQAELQRRQAELRRRLHEPLWAAVDTGAAATCVTNDFPIPLDHARPPRPEEHMMGINGSPEAPVEVGDFTIDAIDPATQEPLEPIQIRNATKLKKSPDQSLIRLDDDLVGMLILLRPRDGLDEVQRSKV